MKPFLVESSQGITQVYLDPGTVTVVPVDSKGLAKREEFNEYRGAEDLAALIATVAEVPKEEAWRIAQELFRRFPVIRRSRWRPWRRRDRKRWPELLHIRSV